MVRYHPYRYQLVNIDIFLRRDRKEDLLVVDTRIGTGEARVEVIGKCLIANTRTAVRNDLERCSRGQMELKVYSGNRGNGTTYTQVSIQSFSIKRGGIEELTEGMTGNSNASGTKSGHGSIHSRKYSRSRPIPTHIFKIQEKIRASKG